MLRLNYTLLMKRLNWFLLGLLAIIVQACGNASENTQSTIAARDTAKVNVPLDRDDAQFAEHAAVSNLTEIELGQLAMKKGVDKRVKNFGMMVMKDQAKADARLQLIARNKKLALPSALDASDKKTIDSLSNLTGHAFDKAYLAAMFKDHETDIKLFQVSSKQLMDPDLRAYAAKYLLTDQRHLDAVDGIKGWMKQSPL